MSVMLHKCFKSLNAHQIICCPTCDPKCELLPAKKLFFANNNIINKLIENIKCTFMCELYRQTKGIVTLQSRPNLKN